MASNIPAALRTADIARFLTRAAQLEKVKPIVSYWCDYWVVNQILSKGLHNLDAECTDFTTKLMDKLEQVKNENATNDAITDDIAAQAYIEQFGLETFQRADNAVRANKASRQTADTFQAAATFLELLNIWGTPDAEIISKIKYAKFHALRIAKSIKAGEDPNASNPAPEADQEYASSLYAMDGGEQRVDSRHRQASVEDVPDEHDGLQPTLARTSSLDQSLHPSRASSVPRPPEVSSHSSAPMEYTLGGPASPQQTVAFGQPSSDDRKNSAGGGYFPSVPTFTSETPGSQHPTAPPYGFHDPQQGLMGDPQSFYTQPTVSSFPPNPVVPPMIPSMPGPEHYRTDDMSMADAQKHAKWAISALNFEDVNTAVKELRIALESLGAR